MTSRPEPGEKRSLDSVKFIVIDVFGTTDRVKHIGFEHFTGLYMQPRYGFEQRWTLNGWLGEK